MKKHDWIIGVCRDLRAYADQNDLPELADAVKNALNIAMWEIDGPGNATSPATTPVCEGDAALFEIFKEKGPTISALTDFSE